MNGIEAEAEAKQECYSSLQNPNLCEGGLKAMLQILTRWSFWGTHILIVTIHLLLPQKQSSKVKQRRLYSRFHHPSVYDETTYTK